MEANSFTKQPEAVCPQLAAPPFVCNGCPKKSRSSCSLTRHVYIARRAQEEYENLLKNSRQRHPAEKEQFRRTRPHNLRRCPFRSAYLPHNPDLPSSGIHLDCLPPHKRGYYSVAPIDLPAYGPDSNHEGADMKIVFLRK